MTPPTPRLLLLCCLVLLAACSASRPPVGSGGILYSDAERIWLIEPSGDRDHGRYELLAVTGKGSVTDPAWSPDAAQIAYSFTPVPGPNATYGSDIYIMQADGGQPHAVFTHGADGGLARAPVWSPDGSAIYFSYSYPRMMGGKMLGVVQQIERLDLATSAHTVIAPGGDLPEISPDGKRLAYILQGNDPQQSAALWVANSDGSAARQLVAAGAMQALWAPRFSPDGSQILISASSTEPTTPRLTVPPLRVSAQSWPSPVSAHGYPLDLWLVDVETGRMELLAALGGDDLHAAWSPDGQRLALSSAAGLFILDLQTGQTQARSSASGFGSVNWSADKR